MKRTNTTPHAYPGDAVTGSGVKALLPWGDQRTPGSAPIIRSSVAFNLPVGFQFLQLADKTWGGGGVGGAGDAPPFWTLCDSQHLGCLVERAGRSGLGWELRDSGVTE